MKSHPVMPQRPLPDRAQRDRNALKAPVIALKETPVCPFSGRACKECAVYRGRHFELCSSRNVRLREIKAAKAKAWTAKWEMPKIPEGL